MLFTHLHVHSYYSLLDSPSSPEALCSLARELGYTHLALTDTNSLAGAIAFLQAAQDYKLHPIFGVQLTQSLPAKMDEPYAIVLARDDLGYAEICQLTSMRQLDHQFDLARVLGRATSHVAVIASDHQLGNAILKQRGKQIFVEITDLSEKANPGKTALQIQRAASLGLASVITNAVHFGEQQEHGVHRALRAIHECTNLAAVAPQAMAGTQAFLKSPRQIEARFGEFRAVLERTVELSRQCCGKPVTGKLYFPRFECPEQKTEFEYLSQICHENSRKRCGHVTALVLKRLASELEVIEQKGFAGYFLAVWDIAQEAKRRGIPTVGRGSAANSLVSFCLEITHVDPLRYGLFFERFLNPEREDPPDIDLDFPWDQRDEMLAYAYERFGADNVAMICTTIRLHGRSAMREAGRIMGLTEQEISAFTRKLPYFGSVEDILRAKATIPESRDLPLHDEPWKTVFALAKRLENIPRHLSVHPGGILIAPGAVDQVMSKEMSAKGVVVTQYDMYAAEDAGFVKIDLLGQRGLAVIRDVSAQMQIDWSRVDPRQDEATRKMMRAGETLGCFYIESPAMRLLLKKLQCDDFELLTAASSIIRPGVSNSGMMRMFIERYTERQPVRYAHPILEKILGDTYGVMVYQEDVIKVVHAVAKMSLGEADKLRRCMSKKRHWEKIETYKMRFFKGAEQNGVPLKAIQEIWRQIESFGGYAFCKAHSASYAQLSFQSAFLRAHYPAAFMAAVLSNQGGFYSAAVYLEEARRMGITILPPHVNKSSWRYCAEGNTIRVGLLAVRGLRQEHAYALEVNQQQVGAFQSIQAILQRTPCTPEEIRILIETGACDGLGQSRTRMLWELTLSGGTHQTQDKNRMLPLVMDDALPDFSDASPVQQLRIEMEHLHLSPRAHPLMLYAEELNRLAKLGTVAAKDLSRYAGRHVTVYGWLVTWRRTRVHKTGEQMKFMTLEDLTGMYEVTLFPAVYQAHGHKLSGKGPYVVEGVVENDRGGFTITAERVDLITHLKSVGS